MTKPVDRINKNCEFCQKSFLVVPWSLKQGRGHYCSKSCAALDRVSKGWTGKNNPNYKDGGLGVAERKKARRKANPEKDKARTAVYLAVKKGSLVREPCKICGLLKVEAHHKDYSKPLEIVWLCKKHHSIADIEDGFKPALHRDAIRRKSA